MFKTRSYPFTAIGFLVSAASLGFTYFFSISNSDGNTVLRGEVANFVANKPYLFVCMLLAGMAAGGIASYIEMARHKTLERDAAQKRLDMIMNIIYAAIILTALALLIVNTQIMWLVWWIILMAGFVFTPAFLSQSHAQNVKVERI